MRLYVLILAGLLCPTGHAAEVLRVGKDLVNIAVTHDEFRKWRISDRVCVYQLVDKTEKKLICGSVVKTTPKGAIVHLEDKNLDVAAGNAVRVANAAPDAPPMLPTSDPSVPALGAPPPRRPAATITGSTYGQRPRAYRLQIAGGGGVTGSTPFPFPQFQLSVQYAVRPKIAIGISPMLFITPSPSGTSHILGAGALATFNYYRGEYFRGLWVQGGAGVLSMTASDTLGTPAESAIVPAALGTIGWRGTWGDGGLNVGVAVGAEYFGTPTYQNYPFSGSIGVLPVVLLDLGFNF